MGERDAIVFLTVVCCVFVLICGASMVQLHRINESSFDLIEASQQLADQNSRLLNVINDFAGDPCYDMTIVEDVSDEVNGATCEYQCVNKFGQEYQMNIRLPDAFKTIDIEGCSTECKNGTWTEVTRITKAEYYNMSGIEISIW